MDKKKIFQIHNLEAKKKEIENNLLDLENKKQILLEQLNLLDPETKSNLETLIIHLENEKSEKQNDIINIKKIILDKNRLYVQVDQDIKTLPDKLNIDLEKEKIIKENEIARIEEKTLDINNEELELIYNLYSQKESILELCNSIQEKINFHNEELINIQLEEHSLRKNTINHLQKLQQEKKINRIMSNKLTENKANIADNIENLKKQIEILNKLKYDLIEIIYGKKVMNDINYNIIKNYYKIIYNNLKIHK